KNKNKSLTEANNKLSEVNAHLYADYIKSKDELKRQNTVEYAMEMELACAKLRELQNKLTAHQDTISVLKQQKDAQIKLYKTREDKDIDKVIDLENKVKVLDNIVYKTGQSVQMMNMLNNKRRTSFVKPGYLKKAKQANPRLYDIGVIPTTSVSRPQLKSNPKGDRFLHNNSLGKKLEVEEHHRNVKLLKNKMSVTACTDSLNAKTVNVKSVSAMCVKCVMTNNHDVCVTKYVAKPIRKTVASESIKKLRNNVRKLHEHFGKKYKWTYIKFTPSGYM
nr:hypothetical protein [Tanacetum cinerariifolium]